MRPGVRKQQRGRGTSVTRTALQRCSFHSDRKLTACFLLGWDQFLAEGAQSQQEAVAEEVSAYFVYMGNWARDKGRFWLQ